VQIEQENKPALPLVCTEVTFLIFINVLNLGKKKSGRYAACSLAAWNMSAQSCGVTVPLVRALIWSADRNVTRVFPLTHCATSPWDTGGFNCFPKSAWDCALFRKYSSRCIFVSILSGNSCPYDVIIVLLFLSVNSITVCALKVTLLPLMYGR
jgi:hypothetical protein